MKFDCSRFKNIAFMWQYYSMYRNVFMLYCCTSRAEPVAACGAQGMRCYHKATNGSAGKGNACRRQSQPEMGQVRATGGQVGKRGN